jgi:hypothetical protein
MARVFLSYAHADGTDAAQDLVRRLSPAHDVWLDRERLNGGASWSREIEQEIDSRDVLLALLSEGAYESIVCRGEQLRALRKGKRVVPIKLQKSGEVVPIYLEAAHFLEYSAGQTAEVLAAIESPNTGVTVKAKYEHTYHTVPFLQRDRLVDRPEELEKLRAAVLSDFGQRQVAVVAVKAMGGIGKTVLAQMLALDSAIQDAFPDGVFWVTIGENPTPEWLIEQMREVGKALQGNTDGFDNLTGCANRLRMALKDKAALVVLDDVWRLNDARHFLAESPHSRTFVTTREKAVAVGLNAREFPLEAMTMGQARELLAKWSGTRVESLPPAADDVIRRCGRLPLGVAMCGAMVSQGYSWENVARDLARVAAELPDSPHKELFAAMRVSVDRLPPGLRERYLDMAMFPPDLAIQESWLKALWGVDDSELEGGIVRLSGASLLTRDGGKVVLHDVQHAYCVNKRPGRETELLQGAMRLSSHVLSRDPDAFVAQMIGRLKGIDLPAVQDITARLRKTAPSVWIEPPVSALAAPGGPLKRTMTGHSGLVTAVVVTPDGRFAVSGHLLATLKVWDLATGAERLTLEGHASSVYTVAVTPDGRCAVSGSTDHTLKVWDLATGAERLTLESHSDSVKAVAVTPDGRFAVSGSHDHTLKESVGSGNRRGTPHARGPFGSGLRRRGDAGWALRRLRF